MVEIESCFLQLSISTVYYYHISALHLNPRDENMPKTSSFSLNLVYICCPTKDILFNAIGDKCRIYHLKLKSIVQRQHSLPAFIDE